MKKHSIANIQLCISDNCSDLEKEILNTYWKLDKYNFVNSPSSITRDYKISQTYLTELNFKFVTFSFELYCKRCKTYKKNISKSQTNFNQFYASSQKKIDSFTCNDCKIVIEKQNTLNKIKKQKEIDRCLDKAVEDKNWKFLSVFDKEVLIKVLELPFYKLLYSFSDEENSIKSKKVMTALYNIEKQHLISLIKDSWGSDDIGSYKYSKNLIKFKNEITFPKENSDSKIIYHSKNNEPTLRNIKNNDVSLSITLNKQIILKPNVKYIFKQQEKKNNHLYLTISSASQP